MTELIVLTIRKGKRLLQAGALLLLTFVAQPASAYSLFTHEQLIDLTWNTAIRPLLLARFPGLSEQALRQAHSYAYGGCVIQDLGYYPFGEAFFSDLTHYVRSGDFVDSLLSNARTADEYAFALGALSHYVGDNIGHHDAVNRATAIAFPKLAGRYGAIVTYDQQPHAHVRTEFGFDVNQLHQHNLAPAAYLRFIGLRVPHRVLDAAFQEVYGLTLPEVLSKRRPTFTTYRWAVRSFLPRIAYAVHFLHRKQFRDEPPGPMLDDYAELLKRADFQNTWNQYRRQPGFETRIVALLIAILPKVGPLAEAAIRIPTAETETLYLQSLNRATDAYASQLHTLTADHSASLQLTNRDLDTGERSRPGDYPLTDKTYAKLLDRLSQDRGTAIPPGLRDDILAYYADPNAPISTRKNHREWKRVEEEVARLRNSPK